MMNISQFFKVPTHLERHAAHVRSEGYQKRQANMAAWQKQQEQIAWLENADKTEAERLADYKATPVYQARQKRRAAWQAKQERQPGPMCGPEDFQPEQKKWWEKLKEEISALILLQNYNDPIKNLKEDSPSLIESWLTDKKVLQWMKKAKGLPPVKLILPIISGFGLDDIPAPLIKSISSDATVRTAGRLLSSYEMSPLGMFAGAILTIGPNLHQNITNRAPLSHIAADVIIDGVGGIVTEVAAIGTGIAVIALFKFPPAYPFVRFPAEAYYSTIWESAVNRYGWREGLTQLLTPSSKSSLSPASIEHPPAVPRPTPAQPVQPPSTPVSPSSEVEVIPTQTPSP